MAWLNGWKYRKSIVIAHTADGAQTNYQLKLLVGESSGATGESVDCGAKVASDFDDLRFTTSDGSTLCDYWIESLSGSTPNQLATVWIEVPSIAAHPDNTTIYMYYGNSGAEVGSNGANTFQFFDDFLGSSLDTTTNWALVGDPTCSVNSSQLTITAVGSDHYIKSKTFMATKYASAVRTSVKGEHPTSTHNTIDFGFGNYWGGGASTNYVGQVLYTSASYTYALGSSTTSSESFGTTIVEDELLHIKDVLWIANNKVQLYKDGSQISGDVTTNIPDVDLFVSLGSWALGSGDKKAIFDWFLVRKLTANEPTWSSFGAEESFYLNRLSPYVHILAH